MHTYILTYLHTYTLKIRQNLSSRNFRRRRIRG